jgi:hypothetical protein
MPAWPRGDGGWLNGMALLTALRLAGAAGKLKPDGRVWSKVNL